MIPAAVVAALEVLRDEPQRQRRLRMLAARVHGELAMAGLNVPLGDSPIVPIILGEAQAALEAAEKLKEMGMLVMPVRPPTVPAGASRLRITLSCEHTDREVEQLIEGVKQL
jgi:8-amino-7-oxononanoate synthase